MGYPATVKMEKAAETRNTVWRNLSILLFYSCSEAQLDGQRQNGPSSDVLLHISTIIIRKELR